MYSVKILINKGKLILIQVFISDLARQAPCIISTFLESYDFSGKIIIPFCTSHSSGIGSSASNIHTFCSESAEWLDGKRFAAGVSKESVQNWIGEIGID